MIGGRGRKTRKGGPGVVRFSSPLPFLSLFVADSRTGPGIWREPRRPPITFFWGGKAVGSSEVEGSGSMRGLDRLVYGSLGPNENLKRRQKREADAVTCRNCHVRLIPAHGKVWDMCVRCLTEFHPGWWVIERKRKAKMGSGIRYGDL